jgi:hypothetical protein
MKKYSIILDFKDKMITVDEVKLPIQNFNYLQGSNTLHALKLNHSLAMEPQSIQDATKHVTRSQRRLQASKRQSAKKLLQLLKKYESLFDNTIGDWKTKQVSFQLKEGVSPYHC